MANLLFTENSLRARCGLDEKTGDPLGFGGEEAALGSCASRDARRPGAGTGRVAGIVKSRGRDIFLPGRC